MPDRAVDFAARASTSAVARPSFAMPDRAVEFAARATTGAAVRPSLSRPDPDDPFASWAPPSAAVPGLRMPDRAVEFSARSTLAPRDRYAVTISGKVAAPFTTSPATQSRPSMPDRADGIANRIRAGVVEPSLSMPDRAIDFSARGE